MHRDPILRDLMILLKERVLIGRGDIIHALVQIQKKEKERDIDHDLLRNIEITEDNLGLTLKVEGAPNEI